MISTGVVRKIDDLGRIVIPKEIRKSLGIRDGESLEIIIEDNKINLVKKNVINNYANEIKEIIDSAGLIIDGNIIITDREKIIRSSHSIVKESDKLPDELIHYIDERLCLKDDKLESFKIGDNEIKGYYLIVPIINEGNSLGLVIIYNLEKPVSEYYMLAKFISTLLVRKIDITC